MCVGACTCVNVCVHACVKGINGHREIKRSKPKKLANNGTGLLVTAHAITVHKIGLANEKKEKRKKRFI